MGLSCCDRFRDDLSAFSDQTLPPKRWEQVAYHLAGCEKCRADLAAINAVCSELKRCRAANDPSATLSARLESIAGEHAEAPLYMASGVGELPSMRRARQRRVTQGSVAILVVVMSAVVFAVLMAPEPIRLSDPVKAAREQYSMSSSAVSVNEAVGAVLFANERGADLGESISYQPRAAGQGMQRVDAEAATALLRRASSSTTSVSGVQRVWAADGDGLYRSAEVRTTRVAGEGAQLEVFDARGDRFFSTFLPLLGDTPILAPSDWDFTQGTTGETVSGRSATHLQAAEDGEPVAGWWFDTETGILLWAERYEPTGAVSLAVGYKSLSFEPTSLSLNVSSQFTLHSASSSQADGWCVGLESCPQEVGGLPLVAYTSSVKEGHSSMTLVYSDGFESAVVGWTEGVLSEDAVTSTALTSGAPAVELWQCGDAVISIATNGSQDLVSSIADDLPQARPYRLSLVERLEKGFERLIPVG